MPRDRDKDKDKGEEAPQELIDALREMNEELVKKLERIQSILLWCNTLVDKGRYVEARVTLNDLYVYSKNGDTI